MKGLLFMCVLFWDLIVSVWYTIYDPKDNLVWLNLNVPFIYSDKLLWLTIRSKTPKSLKKSFKMLNLEVWVFCLGDNLFIILKFVIKSIIFY